MPPRKILHLDLDAFFCSVEERQRPELRGEAFAVGGSPKHRGVVASCSYAARQYGVHSAMPMAQALRACPQLIIVPVDFSAYRPASQQVMEILQRRTALIEQVSIDEAFMDLSDLPEDALTLARALQEEIRRELNLPCSLGAATNKLIAKIANDVGKSQHHQPTPPNAILVVPPGEEAAFLAPLPARALWGIGPKTTARLAELGIYTIGEIAAQSEAFLTRQFGQAGRDMLQHARGIDQRPVSTEHAAKSISSETTFDRDVSSARALTETLRRLSEQVARELRKDNLTAGVVRLKLRWSDFTTITRQVSLPQPTDQDNVIHEAASNLLRAAWTDARPVRLLGVGAGRLTAAAHQLSLWDTPTEKERRLLDALDTLRERYGDSAVQSGRAWKPTRPKPDFE